MVHISFCQPWYCGGEVWESPTSFLQKFFVSHRSSQPPLTSWLQIWKGTFQKNIQLKNGIERISEKMSSESILSFMILWLPPASQIERKWDIWPNYNHFLSFSSLFLYALIFSFCPLKHFELLLLLMCFYLDKVLLSKFQPWQVFEFVFMYVFTPVFFTLGKLCRSLHL